MTGVQTCALPILGQPAMQRYRPQERKPGPDIETDTDLARAAGDIGTDRKSVV